MIENWKRLKDWEMSGPGRCFVEYLVETNEVG